MLVTRFGEPIAEIVPPSPPPGPERWVGSFRESGRVADERLLELDDVRTLPNR